MERARRGSRLTRLTQSLTREHYFLAAALLISMVAAWPLFSHAGLLNTRGGGDSPFLLQRLQQLVTALGDGHFPVRWMPDANYGYGYPFYNFYAPLSIYIAAIFRFIGFSYVSAIKLAQLSGFLVAAWAMFVLGRRWLGGTWPGLLAAAAYSLAPFHLVNIYVRGDSLAEFWAMALYPLVFLTLDQLLGLSQIKRSIPGEQPEKIRRWLVASFALAYGALILSHNISALILSPFVLLFIILQMLARQGVQDKEEASSKDRNWDGRWPVLALFLGLAVSAWFWLPALAERSLAQLDPVTSGYFHFSNHFRELSVFKDQSLVQSSFLFDYDVAGGRTFRMGLLQAVLIIAGLATLLIPLRSLKAAHLTLESKVRPSNSIRLFLISGLLIATFMITPLSELLWDRLPLLSFTQFPWRFLSIQAFLGALVIGALARFRGKLLITLTIIGLLMVSGLGQLKVDFLPLSDEDVTPEKLAQFEWFTGNIGSTVSAEYLPDPVRPRAYTSPWLNNGLRDSAQLLGQDPWQVENVSRSTTSQEWAFTTGEPGAQVVIPTLEWPEWSARGTTSPANETLIQPAPGSGLMLLDLQSQDATVRLELRKTPVRLIGEWLSLVTVVVIGWLSISSRTFRLKRHHAFILLLIVLTSIGSRLWPEKTTTVDDLTWDFSQMAYLHHDENGVRFENGGWLDSYQYSSDTVEAGDSLTITLNWHQVPTGQVDVALTSPAVNGDETVPVITGTSASVEDSSHAFRLEIPGNSPTGLFVPRVTVYQEKPLTPSGQVRGDLFLRPVRITGSGELATGQEQSIDVRPVLVQQRDASTLDIQLQWLTQEPLTQNYNFSMRLVDEAGQWVAQLDQQPGYGFQPSSGWTPGEWVNDWLALPLPADLPARADEQPLTLVMRLYDVGSDEVVLIRPLGRLHYQDNRYLFEKHKSSYWLPENVVSQEEVFAGMIALRGYKLDQGDTSIDLTLYWQALAADLDSYTHFVHLIDPVSGTVVAQHDSLPQNDSYPTSLWADGEIVADHIALDIGAIAPGSYRLQLGLYSQVDGQIVRLPLDDATGANVDGLWLPEELSIK